MMLQYMFACTCPGLTKKVMHVTMLRCYDLLSKSLFMKKNMQFLTVKPSEWNVLRCYDVTTYFQSPFSCIGA